MRHARSALIAVLALSSFAHAFGSKKAAAPEPERLGEKPMTSSTKTSPAVPGQYLISFEATVSDVQRAGVFQKWGVKELEKVGSTPLYLIDIPQKADVEKTLTGLRSSPGVRYVEANLKMHTFGH